MPRVMTTLSFQWFAVEPHSAQLDLLRSMVEQQRLRVVLHKAFPLAQAAAALDELR
jgi:NADPH:quinone reductase-like Zn-dependent oxidoreductase